MEATARTINMDNLRATGRMAEKQVNVALEEAELNGEVIPQEVMNFLDVFKNDATREALLKTTDNASVQKIMNDNGVPMTEEDVDGLLESLGKAGKKLVESDGKLSDEELGQISGGGIGSWFKKAWDWCTSTTVGKIITYTVVGAVAGALVVGGLGAAAAGAIALAAGGGVGGFVGTVAGITGGAGAVVFGASGLTCAL